MTERAVITDPSELDDDARARFVTNALVESKSWLAVATKGTDPRPIAEVRARAAKVAEAAKQLNLAQEIQMDAQKMVRRAERGTGQAVRNGQAAGTVATRGSNRTGRGGRGGVLRDVADENISKSGPKEFFPSSGGAMTAAYAMTDGVTDERFDAAIDEAKAEGPVRRPQRAGHRHSKIVLTVGGSV